MIILHHSLLIITCLQTFQKKKELIKLKLKTYKIFKMIIMMITELLAKVKDEILVENVYHQSFVNTNKKRYDNG